MNPVDAQERANGLRELAQNIGLVYLWPEAKEELIASAKKLDAYADLYKALKNLRSLLDCKLQNGLTLNQVFPPEVWEKASIYAYKADEALRKGAQS